MHIVLLAVGVLMVLAGGVLVRFAMPVEDVAGAAWVIGGVVVVTGGIVVAALAAAVRNLGRIAERLDIQPLPLAPMAPVGREDPAPRPVRAPAPAAGSSLLGWLGRSPAPAPNVAARTPPALAEPAAVDLGPLAQIPETPRPAPTPAVPPPVRPLPRSATPAPQNTPPAVPEAAVYRSGVIDGMAYTLFMDGSIAAELPQGKVKFGSIDELQKFLTEKGA